MLTVPSKSERKAALIESIKNVLVEKAGEHAIPSEVVSALQKWNAAMQEVSDQGIDL